MKKLFLSIVLFLSLLVTVSWADTVVLQWDANTETDLAGYYLYRADKIGDHTTAWKKIATIEKDATTYTDKVDSKNYAWLLTAFDTTDNESFVSNMVERYNRTPFVSVRNLKKQKDITIDEDPPGLIFDTRD